MLTFMKVRTNKRSADHQVHLEKIAMKQAVVITGATGFLGSHLALQLLKEMREHTIICVARGKGPASARDRVVQALQKAEADCGGRGVEDLCRRVAIIDSDLFGDDYHVDIAALEILSGLFVSSFWHCAASIKFMDSQHSSVWNTNVTGLTNALQLAAALKTHVFNHVSTAYVSGTRCGRIPESTDFVPSAFNNVYEESKYHGELLVREECARVGIKYRIVRPSIIIGHSETYRTSSNAGFYQWVDALRQLCNKVTARDAQYFERVPLRVKLNRNATLNLIPVDIVVAEMLALEKHGESTVGQVFHLTSESPVSLNDVLRTVAHVLNISSVEIADGDAELGTIDRLFNKQVRVFAPYLTQRKVFDRTNVARYGVDTHQMNYLLDMERVRKFARSYLDSFAATGGADTGMETPVYTGQHSSGEVAAA